VIFREYLECTFLEPFPPPHCLNKISIPKYVHYHFWPRLLQELGYLLWFIFVSLISCGASQSTNVLKILKGFSLGGQWVTPIGSSPKVLWNPPPPPPTKKIQFYDVLHSYIKPYKLICFTFTWFYTIKNKFTWFLHLHISCSTFTLMWSVCFKPY